MAEYIDCDIKNIPIEVLAVALVTTDTNGDAAIRVVFNEDTGNDLLDCDLKAMSFEQIIRKVVVLDTNGKPALNLASFPVAP